MDCCGVGAPGGGIGGRRVANTKLPGAGAAALRCTPAGEGRGGGAIPGMLAPPSPLLPSSSSSMGCCRGGALGGGRRVAYTKLARAGADAPSWPAPLEAPPSPPALPPALPAAIAALGGRGGGSTGAAGLAMVLAMLAAAAAAAAAARLRAGLIEEAGVPGELCS
jgi:hypothetical protein